MMMGNLGYAIGGYGIVGVLLNMVFTFGLIAGLVVLVAWLWRRINPAGQVGAPTYQPGPAQLPKDILQMRYVRGEITREEYNQMLADLNR